MMMTRFIAFLRAINVGGRVVKMSALAEVFQSIGLTNVETFITSGNVIFESRMGDVALAEIIEKKLKQTLGYEVATFLRTDAELAAIVRFKPFEDLEDAVALNVALLKKPLTNDQKKVMLDFETEIDTFRVHGREVYWKCRVKQSESTFSNARYEKALGVQSTFRGMNTVSRLSLKYPP